MKIGDALDIEDLFCPICKKEIPPEGDIRDDTAEKEFIKEVIK